MTSTAVPPRAPSPQQQTSTYGSPETMLSRRFQTMRPKHHSQKSETNKLIASMTMRSLIMGSGTSQLYRRSLEGDHPTNNNNNSAFESPRGGSSKPTSVAAAIRSPIASLSARQNATSNNNPITNDVQNVFYATLASVKAYNFEQTHADLVLRNPQAPVLGMGNRVDSSSSSSSPTVSELEAASASVSALTGQNVRPTSSAQQQASGQGQVPIVAMQGIPSCLTDEIFVGSLQRRVPNVMPRLLITSIRSIEDLVGACPIPVPNYIRAEVVRRIGVLGGLLNSLRRAKSTVTGNEWDVLISRVLHKVLAAGLHNEATDICVLFRENCHVFPENMSSLQSHLITQLASRSTVLANNDYSPIRSASDPVLQQMTSTSPQPKHADPASGVALQNIPAQNLAPFGVLLTLAENKAPLPPMKTLPGPPPFFPGTPMAIVSGCTRILQAVEQALAMPARFSANAGHLSIHEGTWSWLVQAFRETEKELFDTNAALLSGMCCAANVLNHASQGGPQKFASGIQKVLDTAVNAAAAAASSSSSPSSSASSSPQITSILERPVQATTINMTHRLASVMLKTKKLQEAEAKNGASTSATSSIPPPPAAAAILEVVKDPYHSPECQLLHLRRSCAYSPSSLLAVHGRRRDAIASSILLAVTTLKTMTCATRLNKNFFANAAKVTVFEQKIKVSFLEAICGLAMRLAGLCLTSSNHLVASLAERSSGRAVGDSRAYDSSSSASSAPASASASPRRVSSSFSPSSSNLDPTVICEDPLSVHGPLPLLQLTCHCLIFLGTLPFQAHISEQIRPFVAHSIPKLLALRGLAEESQKLLASTFFFFIRSTPLVHPLTIYDPIVLGFRVVELSLKAFSSKNEIVKPLFRLDQRRNFGRIVESLQKSAEPICNELADTFCFLKSLPKGENVLRHLPASVSVLAETIIENKKINTSNNDDATEQPETNKTSKNDNNSNKSSRLFTDITQEQVSWAAQAALSHFFSRSDSHNDIPRGCISPFSSGMDSTIAMIAKKKKKTVCLKKSSLIAPWRVLLPSVENNYYLTTAFSNDGNEKMKQKVSCPAYHVTSWRKTMEVGNADDFMWKDDGNDNEENSSDDEQ